MKNSFLTTVILICFTVHSRPQDEITEARKRMILGGVGLLRHAEPELHGKTVGEIKGIILDSTREDHLRIAAAMDLLRTATREEDKLPALTAIGLRIFPAVNDDESSWEREFPAAAEVARHPDMMPHVIRGAVDGTIPESVVGSVLLRYQENNLAPLDGMASLQEIALSPEQRRRVEKWQAMLKSEISDIASPRSMELNSPASGKAPPALKETIEQEHHSKSTMPESSVNTSSYHAMPVAISLVGLLLSLVWYLLKK